MTLNPTTILILSLSLCACGGGQATTPEAHPETQGDLDNGDERFGIENERHLEGGLVTSGQPSAESLARAQQGGVATVISLRAPTDDGFAEEEATVRELGMRFVSIPVEGASGLTAENARAVDSAIAEAGDAGVLLHCGSGNRAGAMLALRAFHVQNRSASESTTIGREGGLTRLEADVVAHFEAICSVDSPPSQCSAE